MLTLARALQVIDDMLDAKPTDVALTWNTPLQFDESLVQTLVAEFVELDGRFAVLIGHIGTHPELAARQALTCAGDLHKLRHIEALRMYPLISRGLASDPVARRLFWQSRLVMLGLARRVFRRFDELARTIRSGAGAEAAIDHVTRALAEYRQRNETEIYPLYSLAGRRGAASATQVA